MPQGAPVQFKVMFVIASASAIATLAVTRLVDHLLRAPSMALDIAATLGAMVVAGVLTYAGARIVLGPAAFAGRPLGPLSRSARVELAAGVPVVIVVAALSRAWLHVDLMLAFALLYAPLAFLWLRREFARQ
jgi:hypothetical protein